MHARDQAAPARIYSEAATHIGVHMAVRALCDGDPAAVSSATKLGVESSGNTTSEARERTRRKTGSSAWHGSNRTYVYAPKLAHYIGCDLDLACIWMPLLGIAAPIL